MVPPCPIRSFVQSLKSLYSDYHSIRNVLFRHKQNLQLPRTSGAESWLRRLSNAVCPELCVCVRTPLFQNSFNMAFQGQHINKPSTNRQERLSLISPRADSGAASLGPDADPSRLTVSFDLTAHSALNATTVAADTLQTSALQQAHRILIAKSSRFLS